MEEEGGGNIHGRVHQHCHQQVRRTSCMQRNENRYSGRVIERFTTIPLWENEFRHKIGFYEAWEKFTGGKKNPDFDYKVVEYWDASAAEEALCSARTRFFCEVHGLPYPPGIFLPGPDLYLDEIHWDDEDDDKKNDSIDEKYKDEPGYRTYAIEILEHLKFLFGKLVCGDV